MKNPDRDRVSRLDALPNIGKTIAADLGLIGRPKDLGANTGRTQDPCVIDVFMSWFRNMGKNAMGGFR
jgi:hypothetical protein